MEASEEKIWSEFWFSIKLRPGFSESGSARRALLIRTGTYMMEKKLLGWFQLTRTWRERRREMLSSIRSSTGGEPPFSTCVLWTRRSQFPVHWIIFFACSVRISDRIWRCSADSDPQIRTTKLRIQIWIGILHFLRWLSRVLKYLVFFSYFLAY